MDVGGSLGRNGRFSYPNSDSIPRHGCFTLDNADLRIALGAEHQSHLAQLLQDQQQAPNTGQYICDDTDSRSHWRHSFPSFCLSFVLALPVKLPRRLLHFAVQGTRLCAMAVWTGYLVHQPILVQRRR